MLIGKYADFAEYFGDDVAKGIFMADIARSKKKDKIMQLKRKLLEMPAEDVGKAFINIIAEQCGAFDIIASETYSVQSAERIIFRIQTLEMEI